MQMGPSHNIKCKYLYLMHTHSQIPDRWRCRCGWHTTVNWMQMTGVGTHSITPPERQTHTLTHRHTHSIKQNAFKSNCVFVFWQQSNLCKCSLKCCNLHSMIADASDALHKLPTSSTHTCTHIHFQVHTLKIASANFGSVSGRQLKTNSEQSECEHFARFQFVW